MAVEARFERIDICVTNSGGPPSNSFKDRHPGEWRAAVDQLLMSTVFWARETLPRMQKNNGGRLITITSSAVKQPVEGWLLSLISRRICHKREEVFASWEREIPARHLGKPQELATLVAFLASERASYITGTSIAVEGGLVRSLL